jgi:hypothetical protein
VFANACESDAPEFTFEQDRSFGRAFYTKGAAAFLGTLGKVPEGPAFEFADAFYEALVGAAGGDVGEAFRVARDKMKVHPGVVYALYGNPLKMPTFRLRVCPEHLSAEEAGTAPSEGVSSVNQHLSDVNRLRAQHADPER